MYAALARFGAPLEHLTAEDLAADDLIFQIGFAPLRIDTITTIDGVSFADAWENRVTDTIAGAPAYIIGYDDLLANKIASGRPKDLMDVTNLRRMRRDVKPGT